MASGVGGRDRFPPDHLRSRRGRSGHEHTGLSLFASDAEGSGGSADLWNSPQAEAPHSSLLDDAGRQDTVRGKRDDRVSADAGHGRRLRADHVGDRRDREGNGTDSLSAIEDLDRSQLPNVPDRYRQEAGERVAEAADPRVRDGDAILPRLIKIGAQESAERLGELIRISLLRETYPDPDTWLAACRVVSGAAATLLNMQARADEGAMKSKQFDRLEDLLLMIAEEERHRPLKLIEGQVLDLPGLPDA